MYRKMTHELTDMLCARMVNDKDDSSNSLKEGQPCVCIHSPLSLIRNQLISRFRRQRLRAQNHDPGAKQTHAPTNRAINPRLA